MRFTAAVRALLIATLATACADEAPTRPLVDHVMVLNATVDTVGYVAIDEELAKSVEPSYEVPAATLGGRILPPGEAKPIHREEIAGYRLGAPVKFWIYRVTGGRGYLWQSIIVPPRYDDSPEYEVVIRPPVFYL